MGRWQIRRMWSERQRAYEHSARLARDGGLGRVTNVNTNEGSQVKSKQDQPSLFAPNVGLHSVNTCCVTFAGETLLKLF